MLIILLIRSLLMTSNPTLCRPSEGALREAIYKASWGQVKAKKKVARELAERVGVEARRFALDPIALVAIASAESDFRRWAKGPGFIRGGKGSARLYEYGVWQLFTRGAYTLQAGRLLHRCTKPDAVCPAPDVFAARNGARRARYFTSRELRRSITLGTWVAAYEIREGLKACRLRLSSARYRQLTWQDRKHRQQGHWRWFMHPRSRFSRKHKHGLSLATQLRLSRYGHYNTGARAPTTWYLKRLIRRYARFYKELCGG